MNYLRPCTGAARKHMNKVDGNDFIKISLLLICTGIALVVLSTIKFMGIERPKTQRELYMECYDKCRERNTKATLCLDSCVFVWREYSDAPEGKL